MGDEYRAGAQDDLMFKPTASFPDLDIMLDDRIFAQHPLDDRTEYLFELISQPPVLSFMFSNEGPYGDLEYKHFPDKTFVRGWVNIHPSTSEKLYETVTVVKGDSARTSWIDPEDYRLKAISNLRIPVEYEDSPHPQVLMKQDIRAIAAADAAGVRMFITKRPTLIQNRSWMEHSATILTPEESLPIIGLYLRLQGLHIVSQSQFSRNTIGRKMTYWIAVGALVPDQRRWVLAANEYDKQYDGPQLVNLIRSAVRRLERALEGRDRVFGYLALPQDGYLAEDVLASVDQITFYLMGALDALAIVADNALNLKSQKNQVGWQKESWRKRIDHPALSDLLKESGRYVNLLTVLQELRNTVHDHALAAVEFTRDHDPRETMILIPLDRQPRFRDAIAQLGTADEWGEVTIGAHSVYFHPGTLIDRLISEVFEMIDTLMRNTPVEHLAPPLWVFSPPPPSTRWGDQFNPVSQQRILWQMGLG